MGFVAALFFKFMRSKYRNYILAVVAIAIAVLVVRARWIDQGKEQGRTETRVEVVKDVQKDAAATRARAEQIVQSTRRNEAGLRTEAAAAGSRARDREARARAGDAKLAAAAAAAANTPASTLHAAVKQKLGAAPERVGEPYTPDEERLLLLGLNQLEVLFDQVQQFRGAVEELKVQVAKLEGAQGEAARREQAKDEYLAKLEPAYVQAVNMVLQQSKARSWKCLGMWKCGRPKKIPLPDLDALRGPP